MLIEWCLLLHWILVQYLQTTCWSVASYSQFPFQISPGGVECEGSPRCHHPRLLPPGRHPRPRSTSRTPRSPRWPRVRVTTAAPCWLPSSRASDSSRPNIWWSTKAGWPSTVGTGRSLRSLHVSVVFDGVVGFLNKLMTHYLVVGIMNYSHSNTCWPILDKCFEPIPKIDRLFQSR